MSRTKLTLVSLILLIGAGLRSWNLTEPWIGRHNAFGGALIGNVARNYVRYGYWETRLGPVANSGHVARDQFSYYYHYPPLVPLLISLSNRLFGVHEWSIRLVPLIFSLLSMGLLFAFARRFFSESIALWALLFIAVMPSETYYGAHVDYYSSVSVFFSLLSVYGYARWVESGGSRGLGLCAAGVALGCLTSWFTYFLIPLILAHHLWFSGMPHSKRLWGVASLPFLIFGLFLLHRAVLLNHENGEIYGGLFNKLSQRMSYRGEATSSGEKALGPLVLAWRHGRALLKLCSPPLVLLAAAWLLSVVGSACRKQLQNRDWYLLILLGYGLIHILAFPNFIPGHDYMIVCYAPGISLAAAVTVVNGYRYLDGKLDTTAARAVTCAVGLLSVVTALSLSLVYCSEDLRSVEDVHNFRRWGRIIRASSAANAVVLAPMEEDPILQYYVDRDMRFGLVTFQGVSDQARSAPADCLFICPVSAGKRFGGVLSHLEKRFPSRTEGGLLIYAIRLSGTSSGRGNEPPGFNTGTPSTERTAHVFQK